MKLNISLKNRTALVCGASKGIGKAIAFRLADLGANVIMCARSESILKHNQFELHNENQNHNYIVADSSDPYDFDQKVKSIINTGINIDYLINNSGGPQPGLLHKADPDELLSAFRQHVMLSHLLTQTVVPSMKSNGFGRIINIVSISVRQPIDNLGVSNTIRGAMQSWAKTNARELAPFGITVNNVLPGYTNTERFQSLMQNTSISRDIPLSQVQNNIIEGIPAGRLGEPEEPAYLVAFLCSEFASYINGVQIPVDGGFLRAL